MVSADSRHPCVACRVGMRHPTVEIRFTELHVETEVFADLSRNLPSMLRAFRDPIEVGLPQHCLREQPTDTQWLLVHAEPASEVVVAATSKAEAGHPGQHQRHPETWSAHTAAGGAFQRQDHAAQGPCRPAAVQWPQGEWAASCAGRQAVYAVLRINMQTPTTCAINLTRSRAAVTQSCLARLAAGLRRGDIQRPEVCRVPAAADGQLCGAGGYPPDPGDDGARDHGLFRPVPGFWLSKRWVQGAPNPLLRRPFPVCPMQPVHHH